MLHLFQKDLEQGVEPTELNVVAITSDKVLFYFKKFCFCWFCGFFFNVDFWFDDYCNPLNAIH